MNNSKFVKICIFILVLQLFFSLQYFNSYLLTTGLLLNTVITIFCIIRANYLIFNPIALGALIFYVAFNLPIFYSALAGFINASEFYSFPFKSFEYLFAKSIWVSNIALTGFIIGSFRNGTRSQVMSKNALQVKKISRLEILVVIFWFFLSGLIRYNFKLGVPGQGATLSSFVGVWQHLFYTGNVVLFSFYYIYSLEKINKNKFPLVLISGLILVTTQVILGWKGTIVSFSILCVFLYMIYESPNKIIIQKRYIYLLVLLIPVAIFMADANRNLRLTGKNVDNYAANPIQFVEKTFLRQQGLTRLMVVLDNNSNSFMTNGFFINELIRLNMSATKYIDYEYFKIKVEANTSIGGSGPGCAFLMGGAIFVALMFIIIGFVVSHHHTKIMTKGDTINIVLYANIILILSYLITENIDLFIIKSYIVTILFSFTWGVITKFNYLWGGKK